MFGWHVRKLVVFSQNVALHPAIILWAILHKHNTSRLTTDVKQTTESSKKNYSSCSPLAAINKKKGRYLPYLSTSAQLTAELATLCAWLICCLQYCSLSCTSINVVNILFLVLLKVIWQEEQIVNDWEEGIMEKIPKKEMLLSEATGEE